MVSIVPLLAPREWIFLCGSPLRCSTTAILGVPPVGRRNSTVTTIKKLTMPGRQNGKLKKYVLVSEEQKERVKNKALELDIPMGKLIELALDALSGLKVLECTREHVRSKRTNPRDDEPFSERDFVSMCRRHPKRYMQIIGEWADTVKPGFTKRGQWRVFIKRYVRPAQQLEIFTDGQLRGAYARIEEGMKAGWLMKPTLETLIKFLV